MAEREISKAEFFATVGATNVHPSVEIASLKNRHHVSHWETPQRVRVGRSISDSWGSEPTRFFVVNR